MSVFILSQRLQRMTVDIDIRWVFKVSENSGVDVDSISTFENALMKLFRLSTLAGVAACIAGHRTRRFFVR